MAGPVMITLKSVSTPQIMEVMTNHSKWNKRLGDYMPCTCSILEARFGFVRSECGHVCEKFKELPRKNMSVKTRVMPTGQYLQDNFDKHLSAFFRRNAMKFHVSLEDFLAESQKWTQEYQDLFLLRSIQMGHPSQLRYQHLKKIWDKYLVITRFIDKEQVFFSQFLARRSTN